MRDRAMRRTGKVLTGILAGCMAVSIIGQAVFADGQAAVLETYTGEAEISVYVKGMEEGGQPDVQIATAEAERVQAQPVSEADVPMQTTVMVDNSLSIPEADRGKIEEFLTNLIADRLEGEEIRIASFSEDINMLTDYTADYGTLKKAVDGIAYQNQETYLTDVLYDLLSAEYARGAQDVYRRIVVISDGVDNKSLGYTKDELYALLKSNPVPIYTIGCINGKNNEELENMFALSRMTYVDYFLLDEAEELLSLTETLKADREICRLTIIPPAEMMDGSRKNVKITLPDGTVLTAEVTMPQQVYVAKEPEKPEPEEPEPAVEEPPAQPEELTEIEEPEQARVPVSSSPPEESAPIMPILICVIVGILMVVCVAVVLVTLSRKNKKSKAGTDASGTNIPALQEAYPVDFSEKTEIMNSSMGQEPDSDSTMMIWEQNAVFEMVLTDMASTVKSFQAPLDRPVVIGRKKGMCDIALDYEKSVSGRHCEISARDNRFYVKDLQSSNGTFLNGNKVWGESEIFSGDVLKLGRLELRFEVH